MTQTSGLEGNITQAEAVSGTLSGTGTLDGSLNNTGVLVQGYVLPKATPNTLGGIKVGENLIIDDGKLSADLNNFYNKEEVNSMVSAIPKFTIEVVEKLPTSDISSSTVYLLVSGDETPNLYDEYIYVNEVWEKLGTQKVDISSKAEVEDLETLQNQVDNAFNGEEAMGSIRVEGVKGKNVFNKDTATKTYIASKDDGTIVSSTTGVVSDYINVEGKSKLIVSGTTINFQNGGAFYDNSKTYISGFSSVQMLSGVNIPTNAKYVRVNTTLTDLSTTQVEFNDVATEYTPYKKYGYNSQESMGKIVVDDIECKNLLPIGETESITLCKSYYFDEPLQIGKYFLSVESVTTSGTKGKYVFVFRNSNAQEHYIYLEDGNLKEGFTTAYEFDRVTIYSQEDWVSSQNITTTFNKTMLVKGHTQLPYTKYKKIGGRTDIITGQECPTNEYVNGKRVYVKRIDFGTLPNTTTKSVAHGLTNFTPVRINGIANTWSYYINLPHVSITTTGNIQIGVSATEIEITTGQDRSGFTGIVDIYYTKN